MQVSAKLNTTRKSPQKCRLVANAIRGLAVGEALNRLKFGNTDTSKIFHKLLSSAIANAENNHGADIDELKIETVRVDAGPTYKRFRARARGRGARILKRTSNILLTVSDNQQVGV